MAGYDLIAFTGAPSATSPFFMGESLDGARIALRCDNRLIQLKAEENEVGIAELMCFLGDSSPGLVRVWPNEAPARRSVWLMVHQDMRRSARITAVSAAIAEAFRRQRKTLERGFGGKASGPRPGRGVRTSGEAPDLWRQNWGVIGLPAPTAP